MAWRKSFLTQGSIRWSSELMWQMSLKRLRNWWIWKKVAKKNRQRKKASPIQLSILYPAHFSRSSRHCPVQVWSKRLWRFWWYFIWSTISRRPIICWMYLQMASFISYRCCLPFQRHRNFAAILCWQQVWRRWCFTLTGLRWWQQKKPYPYSFSRWYRLPLQAMHPVSYRLYWLCLYSLMWRSS